jgi:streptogramin lyase
VFGRLGLVTSILAGATVATVAVVAVNPQIASAADPVVTTTLPSSDFPSQIATDRSGDLVWTTDVELNGALSGNFNNQQPTDVALGPDGNMWVTYLPGGTVPGTAFIRRLVDSVDSGTFFRTPEISEPLAITAGPDNAMWFVNEDSSGGTRSIGRISLTGEVSSFPVALPSGGRLNSITTGPDGNLWFTNEGTLAASYANSSIGRITPAGDITLFTGAAVVNPHGIAAGPDGNLWFANRAGNSIGRITPSGVLTAFTDPTIGGPLGIVAADDGALWFTNSARSVGNSIGRITTGATPTVSSYTNSPPEFQEVAVPWGITAGPGPNLYFTDRSGGGAGVIGQVALPSYTVNDTGDGFDETPGDDLCRTSTGECTLRAAIEESNAHPGHDIITFNIPGPGPHTIVPTAAALPQIEEGLTIDGYTQPESVPNTLVNGSNATISIELDGTGQFLSAAAGLQIFAPDETVTVRGLAINGFEENGVRALTRVVLEGNFIGIAPDGTTARGNDNHGVLIGGGGAIVNDFSVIGGVDLATRNIISGNDRDAAGSGDGIFIDTPATNTLVAGNLIGTDRTGTQAVANLSGLCACTSFGVGNTRIERNVLSGNRSSGLYTNGASTIIRSNLIGTTVTGLSSLPNVWGVLADNVATNTQIGDGTVAGRNVIGGNIAQGVWLAASPALDTAVRGNYIGVGADGSTPVGNGEGIFVNSPAATNIRIGGSNAGEGNVIGNNLVAGMTIQRGPGTRVLGNQVFASGQGIVVEQPGTTGIRIGGTNAGEGNVIRDNSGAAVRVANGVGTRVDGNQLFDNGAGIVLGTGPTNAPNDADDADTGANNLQNSPEILSATLTGAGLEFDVSIDSLAPNAVAPIRIDFYVADDAISPEGERYLGSRTLLATPSGANFTLSDVVVVLGDTIVATATDADGNTSPFSAPVSVSAGAPTAISLNFEVAAGESTVQVAPSGIPVRAIDRGALQGGGGAGSVAASSIEAIGPQDTALAAITIGSTPLRAIVLESAPLRAIPLVDIEVNQDGGGGWPELLDGTSLQNVPFVNITFGDALDNAEVSNRIAALPLRAIDVAGTPLRAIPIAAIALGSTPLRAIPLRAIAPGEPNPWCAIVASLEPDCEAALDNLNLMEITLRGVPLRAIPLRAIPLRAIDLNASPLRAIPLRAIDLEASPLRAIPLRAIDLEASPLGAIPLRAIPLRAIPLRAIDVNSVPLRAIDVNSTPLRAIEVEGLSVNGAPLRAIPLRAIPLRAIDLEASPLRAIPLRAIPLRAIPLRAIDLEASPLRAIPLRAIDIEGSPLATIPLRAIDLQASPLRAIPLRAIPLRAIPLRAIPLRAIDVNGTPLRAIPLRAIDVLGSPLRAIPLRAIAPGVVNCQLVDCSKATLGEAVAAGAVNLDQTTLGAILDGAEGIRLDDIASSFRDFSATDLAAAIAASDHTLAEFTTLDDLVLGDLPTGDAEFDAITLGDLGAVLANVSVGDLIGRAINATTNDPYTEAQLAAEVNGWTTTVDGLLANQGDPGVLTVGDLLDATSDPVQLQDLGSLLDFITVDQLTAIVGPALADQIQQMSTTLEDLTPAQLGRLTLLDLVGLTQFGNIEIGELLASLSPVLDDYTLGDLLLAMVDPGSLAAGGVEFDTFDERSLPAGTIGATTFNASFTLTSAATQNVTVEVELPSQATYVAGTALVDGTAQEPTQVGQTLVWSQAADGAAPVDIEFDVLPALRLGATSLVATATVVGTGESATSSASITVAEGSEPNDFDLSAGAGSPRQTTPAVEDVVYLSYIPTTTDIDVFEVELAENDRLVVQLSNLDADLDVAVWGRPSNARVAAALGPVGPEAPLSPVLDPDADGADAAAINDFVRLDELDPSLRLIATSNQSGTANEVVSTDRVPAGTYFVQVYGANGATNVAPASLQLKVVDGDSPPVCRATSVVRPLADTVAFPAAPTIPTSANTLILVNQSRIEQFYSAADRTDVTAAIDRLTNYLGANPTLGVSPVVVPVDAYPAVRAAYAAWDSPDGSCDPEAANAVVAAINSTIIDPRRGQFEHIVFLGGDELIPMARVADGTTIANEFDFRNELDGQLAGGSGSAQNSVTSPFWQSMVRSDEPYGDAAARRSGDGYLYVSDVALGRVVETPAEIVDALDTFVSFGGNLSIDTATVLGYDFLSDGSEAVADELVGAGLPVYRALASGRNATDTGLWTADDATEELRQAGTEALISLNAHFDYYRALPSVGDKVPGFNDNLIATEVATALGPDALARSLVFSMGCHSGLSVSDVLVGSPNTDWAQTMGRQGSLYVGNTGFGYGDTETVAYTEELMRLFAERVTSPFALPLGASTSSSTVGQALTWAKNDFVAGLQTYSVYDKKAVMESTFYGLPFYRVGLTPEPLPPTPTRTAGPDGTGTSTSRVDATAVNTIVTTPSGSYPANFDADGNELVIVAPGRPVQPRLVEDVSVVDPANPTALGQVAHGAIVEDMSSTYVALPDPVIATPVFGADRAEPEAGDVAFPTKPLEISTVTGPSGERQQLVLATGQYRADTGVQRLDNEIDVVVYYASPTETDFTAPTIGAVDSEVIGGRLAISTTVDDAASSIDRVYVLVVQNPGVGSAEWTGIDLVRTGSTDRWTGSLVLTPGTTDVEFIVQAKDGAGNVGFATNKARNFDVDQPPAPPAPPAQVLTAAPAAPPAGSGVYGGDVEIVVTANAAATYSVDGAPAQPVPASGRFTITGEGPHTWQVSLPSGYAITGTVLIDTSAPVVAADRASGDVRPNTPVTLSAGDAGAGIASITYSASGATTIAPTTVNGGSVAVLLSAVGSTTITVFATDTVGNVSAPRSFTYVVDGSAPVVTGVLSQAANTDGWHRGPFQITWITDDPTAAVPPPTSVTTEGAGLVITSAPSCDAAGNCGVGSVTVSLDLTAPAATIATDIAANAADWNNTPVRVTVTCGPDLSGVVCPAPVVVSTDGVGQRVDLSVVDTAGNSTSLSSRVINLDRVPPVVTWTAPADGATVSGATYVRPTCVVTDALSGPDGVCTLDIPEPVTTTPGRAVYTATAVGTDRAGNTTTLTSTYTVLTDQRGPDIDVVAAPAANAAGWWRSAVTFTFTCTDSSGVASCPAPRTVSAQGANQAFTVSATDVAGNTTPLNVSAVNIDLTPPVVTVTAPTTVGPLDTVTIRCAATDVLSGIAASSCVDRTVPASTLNPGANILTFSATDVAGNVTTTTRTITLVIPSSSAPTVRADMGVAGLNEIGFQTNIVVVNGTFADPGGPGPFTASVRWTAGGTFTRLVLNNNSQFVAAFIYGSAGTRTVTVRICDAAGNCGTDDIIVRTSVTQRITPVRQCVVDRGAGASPRYQARWGYDNPAPFAIAVPSIPILENTFTTAPFFRGQPQILQPGAQRNAFTTTFQSGTNTWRINGRTASASSTSPHC